MTTTHTIQISQHAIERFQERARPGLDIAGAADELARLIPRGELTATPPAWHAATCAQIAPWYLVAGDVVLPLKEDASEDGVLVAATCLVRGLRTAYATRRRRASRRASRGRRLQVV